MKTMAGHIGRAALAAAMALASLWLAGALWYQGPSSLALRVILLALVAALTLAAIVALLWLRAWKGVAAFALVLLVALLWWSTIAPPASDDYAPDVSRQTTGRIDGDRLVIDNVRHFDWRSDDDYTQRWEPRAYDLRALRTVDMFVSYWAGPRIAHTIFSFGFADGRYLAWSTEVRKRRGEQFSSIAGFFKHNTLVLIAADERDVVRVRSNVRGEQVYVFRLKLSPAQARALLAEFVDDANDLARAPAFYNTLVSNCTTVVVKMMKAVGLSIPRDWRLVLNGYFPQLAYDRGALDTREPFETLKARGDIVARSKAADGDADYAAKIRQGVPAP